jgi:hypothetical protein
MGEPRQPVSVSRLAEIETGRFDVSSAPSNHSGGDTKSSHWAVNVDLPPNTGIQHYSALIATIPRVDRQEWLSKRVLAYPEPIEDHY